MKALPNNNKPATHYFEVYKCGDTTNQIIRKEQNTISAPLVILAMVNCLERTVDMGMTTIAIFKIRLK